MPKANVSRWGGWGAGILVLLLAGLVCWVRMPPVMDFPNHLARIWLLSGGADIPPESAFYRVDWSRASTNIGVDFVAAALARVTSIMTVSKILLLLMFLGPPIGGMTLHRAIFGRTGYWALAFLAPAWGTTAIAGFMGYQISLTGALFAATVFSKLGSSSAAKRLAVHLLLSSLLLCIHPFGLLFYLVLAAGITIGPIAPVWRSSADALPLARSLVYLGLISMVPVLLLFALAPHPPGASGAGTSAFVWGLRTHLTPIGVFRTIFSPFLSYDVLFDLICAVPFLLVLVAAGRTRQISIHFGLLAAAGGLFLLSLVTPSAIGDASWLDRRLPLMTTLTLFAAVRPEFRQTVVVNSVAIGLFVVAAVRAAWIAKIWVQRDADITQLYAATGALPVGASVLILKQEEQDWGQAPLGRFLIGAPGGQRDTARHIGSLLVIRNHVFIPTLFSIPGQHAIAVQPAKANDATTSSSIPNPSMLGQKMLTDPYLAHWRTSYQYLLLLNADLPTAHPLIASGLTPISAPGFARLYRIDSTATR